MRNYLLFPLCLFFLFSFNTNESKKVWYKNGQLRAEVKIEHGMFNGNYTAWYRNGQKMAEGKFLHNQRIGTWQLWDSLGMLRVVREYSDGFTFTTRLLKMADGTILPLPVYPKYQTVYNNLGEPDYPFVEKQQILIFKALWRRIDNVQENAALFNDDALCKIVKNYATTQGNVLFDDYKLNNLVPMDSVLEKLNNTDYTIVGFRLYEGWNYFGNYQMSDYWVMGICPIIQKQSSGKTEDLGWVRYSDIRGDMALVVLSDNDGSATTLETLMHQHAFHSVIYKEANIFDRAIADYKRADELQAESDRISIDILDMEHEMWMALTEQ